MRAINSVSDRRDGGRMIPDEQLRNMTMAHFLNKPKPRHATKIKKADKIIKLRGKPLITDTALLVISLAAVTFLYISLMGA